MQDIIEYDFGISAIDAHYDRPRLAAVHLVVEDGRAALIDTAHNAAVPRIMATLAHKGIAPTAVDFVVLTHIHLDHAGGAGQLMRLLPNAQLVVHPRGVRHMRDPRALIVGVAEVYGADNARRIYGEILPIDGARIIEATHGSAITLGSHDRRLAFIDTPGHARHHVCIRDSRSGHIFTGDTFGLSYRELDVDGRPSIMPTTSPVQFDPAAAHCSIDAILALRPAALYLTHFSQVRDVERLGADMHRLIDAHAALAETERGRPADGARHARLQEGVKAILRAEGRRQGWLLPEAELFTVLAMDIELNAAGLGSWLDARQPA